MLGGGNSVCKVWLLGVEYIVYYSSFVFSFGLSFFVYLSLGVRVVFFCCSGLSVR